MEFKNTYCSPHGAGLPFEKVTKDSKEYIRQINSDELIEYSHDKVDSDYIQDPLFSLAGYINRNLKNFPYVVVDICGNLALSKMPRDEYRDAEKLFYKDHDNYESYKKAVEEFRGETLFYILTPDTETFYKNEPFIITPEVQDFIFTMHWHFQETTADNIVDIFYNWKSIHKSLTNFIK